jgi:ABC-type polysaccharide/polyol phosphate transport system ATPase subunit
MSDTAVYADNLSKKFKVYKKPYHRLLEWASFGSLNCHEDFWALKNVSFRLKKGESLGIVGPNGAGKSTLLKILTGALFPTAGSYSVNGRVVSLLELGTGFHPELTGLQNIHNSASLLGFEPSYVEKKLNDIIEFSGLKDFLDRPVKTYSSGMFVRLAFSLFANLDPDVYIVDEALAVGDVFFQQKCYAKLEEMRNNGVSIIIVSHDPAPIVKFCDHAIMIDHGSIVYSGKPDKVIEMYQAKEFGKRGHEQDYNITVSEGNIIYGNRNCEIIKSNIHSNGQEKNTFFTGEQASIDLYLKCSDKMALNEPLNIGFQIKNRFGSVLYGTNTFWNKIEVSCKNRHNLIKCSFHVCLNLGPGEYTVSAAVAEAKRHAETIYYWSENITKFQILEKPDSNFGGEVFLPVQISLTEVPEL